MHPISRQPKAFVSALFVGLLALASSPAHAQHDDDQDDAPETWKADIDGPESATPTSQPTEPERATETVGGWTVTGQSAREDHSSGRILVGEVRGHHGSWWFSARRAHILADDTVELVGDVRLIGPDDVYVTAARATYREKVFLFEQEPTFVGPKFTLPADSVRVDVARAHVELTGVHRR